MAKEVNILLRILVDFTCFLIVGLPLLVLYLIGVPYHRGFYCDDQSLRYPYLKSTITEVTVILVGIFVIIFVMTLTESLRYRRKKDDKKAQVSRVLLGRNVHPLVWKLYIKIGVFLFGCLLCQMTTDIAKYSTGRLRPHFWDLCQPNVVCSFDNHTFVTDFACRNQNAKEARESRLSFMSGHSSFSAFTMVYLALYMQARVNFRGFRLLRPFLQAVGLYAAYFTALTRVSDYHHHWSDVLAGSFQGIAVALLVVFYISDIFPKTKIQTECKGYKAAFPVSGYHSDDQNTKDPERCV